MNDTEDHERAPGPLDDSRSAPADGSCGSNAACPQYLPRGLQRGPYHLIHVVVAVLGEATHEGHALLARGEGPVPPVEGLVFRARDRVVGISGASRVLTHDGRAGMLLAGKVLELGDAYVVMFVRIVDGRHPLVAGHTRQVRVLEAQRPVGQPPEAVIEVGVYGSGVHNVRSLDELSNLAEVDAQLDAYVGVIQHRLEHLRVALPGQSLEIVRPVAVVAIGAHGDAGGHPCAQLRGIEAPVLAGVVLEELLVEVTAYGVQHHVLAGEHRALRLPDLLEKSPHLLLADVQPIEPVHRVEVDGYRQQLAVHVGERAVLVRSPLREIGEVFDDAPGVGVEDVRPVPVDQDTLLIVLVVSVAPDVGSLLDYEYSSACASETLGDDAAGVARTNHQNLRRRAASPHRSRHRYSPPSGNGTPRSSLQAASCVFTGQQVQHSSSAGSRIIGHLLLEGARAKT